MLRRLPFFALVVPVGVAALIIGAKLALIHAYASDQPFADQWAAEGAGVIRSASLELWQFRHFIAPHGEHSPALMRVVTAATHWANSDQWDARVEMGVSVLGVALIGLLFWQLARDTLTGRWPALAAAGAALLWAMPVNSENYLWGFQTPFVFLVTLGLTHVRGALLGRKVDATWWLGHVAGMVSVVTLASGFLSAVMLVGAAGICLWRDLRSRWGWATLVANVAISAAGFWLLRQSFVSSTQTTAISMELVRAFGQLLAWPWPQPGMAVLVQAPALFFIGSLLRKRTDRPAALLVALLGWAWLLAAAIAWGRGATPGQMAGRYQDHLTLGLALNVLLACRFAASAEWKRGKLLAGAWALGLALGAWQANRPAALVGKLEANAEFFVRQERVIRQFLATADPGVLKSDPVVAAYMPHWPETLGVLSDPVMRTMLPPSIAPTVAIARDPQRSTCDAAFGAPAQPLANNARVLTLHGGAAGARFVSHWLPPGARPVWRWRVSGRFGPDAGQLRVRAQDGKTWELFEREFDATGRWKTVHLVRGGEPARLEITVPPGAEVQVTEPVELGWLSWWVPKLASWGPALVALGIGLLVAGGLLPPAPRPVVTRAD